MAPGYRMPRVVKAVFQNDGSVSTPTAVEGWSFENFDEYPVGPVTTLAGAFGWNGIHIKSAGAGFSAAIEAYTDTFGLTKKRLAIQQGEFVGQLNYQIPQYSAARMAFLIGLEDTGANISGELWTGFCCSNGWTKNTFAEGNQHYCYASRYSNNVIGAADTFTRAVDASGQVYYTCGYRHVNVYRTVPGDVLTTYYQNNAASGRGIACPGILTKHTAGSVRIDTPVNNLLYASWVPAANAPTSSATEQMLSELVRSIDGNGITHQVGIPMSVNYISGHALTTNLMDAVNLYWMDRGGGTPAKFYIYAVLVKRQLRPL